MSAIMFISRIDDGWPWSSVRYLCSFMGHHDSNLLPLAAQRTLRRGVGKSDLSVRPCGPAARPVALL